MLLFSMAYVRRDVVRLVTPGTITEERLLEPGRANAAAGDPARAGRGPRGLRPRGARHLDRRVHAQRDRRGGPRARRSRGSSRARSSRRRACSTSRGFARLVAETRVAATPLGRDGGDGAARGAARLRVLRRRDAGRLRRLHARRDRRRRAGARLCQAHPVRARAGARAAVAPRARREPRDRRGDARQSRTDAHACRASARGSLLATIDLTVTPAGARLLAERLASPLTDPAAIAERLDAVGFFVEAPALRDGLARRARRRARFPARAGAARPRSRRPARSRGAARRAGARAPTVAARLDDAADSPPAAARAPTRGLRRADGALGARSRGDARRRTAARTSATAASCAPARAPSSTRRARCATKAGASSPRCRRATPRRPATRQLKIKHNNFLGFYIETPQAAGETLLKPPHSATFIHRQTMAGAMRFTTNALIELEARIASAADRALALELDVFERAAAGVPRADGGVARLRRGARRNRRRRRARRTRGQARLDAAARRRFAELRDRGRPPSRRRGGAARARRAVRRQ